jgi:diacylglycerol O-acyltransferase
MAAPLKQLSALDASFLYLETPEMPMHVGALHVFELPAGHRGRFVTALRRHVAARLPIMPALRRRLWWMPLNVGNPAWVDAEPDLDEHIVEVKLPKGSGLPELEVAVGRLHAGLLDRRRPLWKFHVFEGLAAGPNRRRRVGLYTQLHHAAVDGQAAVALATALLDATPEPRAIEVRPSQRPRKLRLGLAEMISGTVAHQVQQLGQLLRSLPTAASALTGAAAQVASRRRESTFALAPRTRYNGSASAGRSFAAASVPLAEAKALGRALGGTLNDVVLMLCSSALRAHLKAAKELPRKSLVAAVPISLREKGDATADNQASIALVSLGTQVADAGKRFAHIVAATSSMKATLGKVKHVLPTDLPSVGLPWLLEAGVALYRRARAAERLPPIANVAISNVPGPPMPLFLAGARMLSNHPTSIVVHGVALNITVQSYDQQLDFGFVACADAEPQLRALADGLQEALDGLRRLAATKMRSR